MNEELLAVVVDIGRMFMKSIPISLALAAVFTVLTQFWACNPGRPWWRKQDLVTDLCYWFFIPVVTRYFRIGLLIAGAAVFFHITTADGLIAFYENGHGPLAALPLVVQMLIFLVGEDVITYWTHRLFHGGRLWKYHAVHHSSEELEWISAARFHPINLFFGAVIADVVLLLAGISPNVFVVLGPVTIAHSAFVHANLDWTFGPFKYVIATPVFHRWHHTTAERGGEKNFAATFPVLDLIFGTFYMPAGEKPDRYGIADREFPTSFGAQLLRRSRNSAPDRARWLAAGAVVVCASVTAWRPGPQDMAFAVRSPIWRQLEPLVRLFCIVLVRVAFRGVSMSGCAGASAASSSLRFLSAVLFLFAAAAPAGAVEPIFVPMDQARILKIPDRTATLVIGNPLIADVTVERGGIAVVTAKGHGTTNIVALDGAGIVLMERPIEVKEPAGPTVVVYRGSTRQTYSCTPECSALVALGDTGKDYFDKDSFQELDPFKKTIEQTTTRNAQAAAAGAGR